MKIICSINSYIIFFATECTDIPVFLSTYKFINRHGYDILRKSKNREYSRYIKEHAINRVLINNESVWYVAIDIGLPIKK